MLPHHQRIADEYAADVRDIKRERWRFMWRTLAWCWAWVIIGGLLMGESFHINAVIGWIYFPKLMAKAQAFFLGGLFVGSAGPVATLLVAWRRAMDRGLLD
jgi:hypothetical protein